MPRRKPYKNFYFDYKNAERAKRFIEKNVKHVEGVHKGKPFILEPWQATVIEDIFGWKVKGTNLRRYRVLYIEVPRKNGKSTLGAAIALYLLFADKENGAQIVSAASNKEQAQIIFKMATDMVEMSPTLSKISSTFSNSLVYYKLGNSYKALSADKKGKHGKNLHGILFDELHEQPNRELVDTLKTSMGTRLQPLEVYMTTAGYDRTSICYEYHDYAVKVKEGIVEDDSFYPVLFFADDEDEWTDPKVWAKANPNLGITVRREFLERECKSAQEIPAYENTFRRLYLNQWTEQESRMIPMHQWAKTKNIAVTEEELEGLDCYGGLDLASTEDIASFCLVFPIGKLLKILPYFFCPKEIMPARHKKNQLANYPEWERRGYLIGTEGNVIDYDFIRNFILEKYKKFNIKKIGYDRWNATQLTNQLAGEGLDMEPFGQGFKSMNAPTKEFLKKLQAQELHHGGHPVLSWNAQNVASEVDADQNIKPSKKKSKEKIDGIVSVIMGLGMYISTIEEPESVYEERGLISF